MRSKYFRWDVSVAFLVIGICSIAGSLLLNILGGYCVARLTVVRWTPPALRFERLMRNMSYGLSMWLVAGLATGLSYVALVEGNVIVLMTAALLGGGGLAAYSYLCNVLWARG